MDNILVCISIISAIIALAVTAVAFGEIRKAKAVQFLYKELGAESSRISVFCDRKVECVDGLMRQFAAMLVDLARCTDIAELNWKLSHIRSVADILKCKTLSTDQTLYDAVVKAFTTASTEDRRSLTDAIFKDMGTYFALSPDKDKFLEIIESYLALYVMARESFDAANDAIKETIRPYIDAAKLNFAVVEDKPAACDNDKDDIQASVYGPVEQPPEDPTTDEGNGDDEPAEPIIEEEPAEPEMTPGPEPEAIVVAEVPQEEPVRPAVAHHDVIVVETDG